MARKRVSPQARWQRRRRKLGRCVICGRDSGGVSRCDWCQQKLNARRRKDRRLLKLLRSCIDCEGLLDDKQDKGMARCAGCRSLRAERERARRAARAVAAEAA